MPAKILDGKALAARLQAEMAAQVQAWIPQVGRPPGLAVLRVGEDPASAAYVRGKERACERCENATTGNCAPRQSGIGETVRPTARCAKGILSTFYQLKDSVPLLLTWQGRTVESRREKPQPLLSHPPLLEGNGGHARQRRSHRLGS